MAEEQQELAGADGGLEVLASKGAHITVPRDRIRADAATGVITSYSSECSSHGMDDSAPTETTAKPKPVSACAKAESPMTRATMSCA